MKKFFLQLMIIGFLSVIFSGCCFYQKPQIAVKPDLTWENSQLRKIAFQLGISQSRILQLNMQELITDIQIKINESDEYHGDLLSETEKKQIKDLLYGEIHILKILNDYDLFIQKINNRQIIILQDKSK